ncbi:hypothetical protein L0Z72_06295 [candidate division KSB1 bacterium]|nr:hypothetical protein [candidate division KSB1 bacterium]
MFDDNQGEHENKGSKIFPVLPIGLNMVLYNQNMVSFQVDLGYQISLSKLEFEKDYIEPSGLKPDAISVFPQGFISSVKIKMYF